MEKSSEEKAKVEGKKNKIEVKENIDVKQLRSFLQNWINALDEKKDFEFELKGSAKRVPYKAYSEGRLEVEAEWKEGENEFEIELKWPGRPEDMLLKQ